MENGLRRVVCNIHMKSDMQERLIARCETEASKTGAVRKARWNMIAAAAACCAIIALSFAVWPHLNGNMVGVVPPDESRTDASETTSAAAGDNIVATSVLSDKTGFTTVASQSLRTPTTAKTEPPSGMPSITVTLRNMGDFVPMTLEELEHYYGRKIVPAYCPEDLVLQDDYSRGIIKRNDKTPDHETVQSTLYKDLIKDGDILFDDNSMVYRGQINDRSLSIRVAKDRLPFNSVGDPSRFSNTIISGVEVRIAHYNDAPYSNSDMYTALVIVDQVGYHVLSNNLTQDEFMKVVSSICDSTR